MGSELIVNSLPIVSSLLLTLNIHTATPNQAYSLPMAEAITPHQKLVWEVKHEKSLEAVALVYYGDKNYWKTLWSNNPEIKDPKKLEKGQKLVLRAAPLKQAESLNPMLEKRLAKLEADQRNATMARFAAVAAAQVAVKPSNYDDVYKEAAAKYGVSWEILYGLHLTESGLRDGAISNAQGSGAQGPMQFMPGTWRAYAVDGDGDGVTDINNAQDAIHAAANYLAKHGSLESGLRSYGGNTAGVLAAARARGFNQ